MYSLYSYASNKFFFSVGMIYTFLGFPGGKRKMPSFPFLIMPLASCIQSDERAHSFILVWKASHERRCCSHTEVQRMAGFSKGH